MAAARSGACPVELEIALGALELEVERVGHDAAIGEGQAADAGRGRECAGTAAVRRPGVMDPGGRAVERLASELAGATGCAVVVVCEVRIRIGHRRVERHAARDRTGAGETRSGVARRLDLLAIRAVV